MRRDSPGICRKPLCLTTFTINMERVTLLVLDLVYSPLISLVMPINDRLKGDVNTYHPSGISLTSEVLSPINKLIELSSSEKVWALKNTYVESVEVTKISLYFCHLNTFNISIFESSHFLVHTFASISKLLFIENFKF